MTPPAALPAVFFWECSDHAPRDLRKHCTSENLALIKRSVIVTVEDVSLALITRSVIATVRIATVTFL
jgi:hypothetical protein